MKRTVLLALLLSLAPACAIVPGTGRHQLALVPGPIMLDLGQQTWDATLAESKIITSGKDAAMVQRVGQRVAAAARRLYPDPADDYRWEIVLIDDPQTVNAWSLPGGKSAVYSGLLPVTQSEDALAVVVGHEVAHAIAGHGNERISQNLLVSAGLTLAQILSGDMKQEDRQLLLAALGAGAQVGVLLPYSRGHESEADELGLYLAADAGYDPRAAIGLWQRMGAQGGERPPEFLSTHPSESTRIERLQEIMPKALKMRQEALAEGR